MRRFWRSYRQASRDRRTFAKGDLRFATPPNVIGSQTQSSEFSDTWKYTVDDGFCGRPFLSSYPHHRFDSFAFPCHRGTLANDICKVRILGRVEVEVEYSGILYGMLCFTPSILWLWYEIVINPVHFFLQTCRLSLITLKKFGRNLGILPLYLSAVGNPIINSASLPRIFTALLQVVFSPHLTSSFYSHIFIPLSSNLIPFYFSQASRLLVMSTQPLLQRTANKRIALPIRVEPKIAFANERTFLSWLHFTVVLGGLAVGLLNFGDKVS